MASAWCCTSVCSAISTMDASSTAASAASAGPCPAQKWAGSAWPIQSTTRPSSANSSASNAARKAASTVSSAIRPRMPCVQAHTNGTSRLGGKAGSAAG